MDGLFENIKQSELPFKYTWFLLENR
jgi:hypothetical protein